MFDSAGDCVTVATGSKTDDEKPVLRYVCLVGYSWRPGELTGSSFQLWPHCRLLYASFGPGDSR